MKLYYEEQENVLFEKEINEANGSKPRYKISGIFSTIGEKNKNGRVYPSTIWESQVANYQDTLSKGASNSLMELNHPPRANVDMMEAVAKIEKLYISGDKKYVMGEAFLLDNPKANQLKTLIDAGIKMSVSSRGVGKVSATGMVENFKLSTYDIIPDQGQSDYNAEMMGIVEGVLQEKEFEILENGCVGECELPSFDKEPLVEAKEVVESVGDYANLKVFKGILESKGAEIMCDLDMDTKEEVLSEFVEAMTSSLKESFAEYKEYVTEEINKFKKTKVTQELKESKEEQLQRIEEKERTKEKKRKAQELIASFKNA